MYRYIQIYISVCHCLHVWIHTCIHTYTNTHRYMWVHTCVHTYSHVQVNSGVCRCIKLCASICMCTDSYRYIDATVYMCIDTYIYKHTQVCAGTPVHKSILPNSDEYRCAWVLTCMCRCIQVCAGCTCVQVYPGVCISVQHMPRPHPASLGGD